MRYALYPDPPSDAQLAATAPATSVLGLNLASPVTMLGIAVTLGLATWFFWPKK